MEDVDPKSVESYRRFLSLIPKDFRERLLAREIVRAGFRAWVLEEYGNPERFRGPTEILEGALYDFFDLVRERTAEEREVNYVTLYENWAREPYVDGKARGSPALALPAYFTLHQITSAQDLVDKIDREMFSARLFHEAVGEPVPGSARFHEFLSERKTLSESDSASRWLSATKTIADVIYRNTIRDRRFWTGFVMCALLSLSLLIVRSPHPPEFQIPVINQFAQERIQTREQAYCFAARVGYQRHAARVNSLAFQYDILNLDPDQPRPSLNPDNNSLVPDAFLTEEPTSSHRRVRHTALALRDIERGMVPRSDSINFDFERVPRAWASDYLPFLDELSEGKRSIILSDILLLERFIRLVDAGESLASSDLLAEVSAIEAQC